MFARINEKKTERLSIVWTFIVLAMLVCQASAGETGWATGPALKLRLDEPVDIFWSNNPLRRAFDSVSRAKGTAILIDRRIDPGRELSVSLTAVPLGTALKRIAADQGLELTRLDDILYLGPDGSANRLSAARDRLAETIRRLPKESQRKLFSRRAISWPDLAEPRELIGRLAREENVMLEGLESVPHDLWAAADLPPLTLADRLLLIAFQFDLTPKPLDDDARLRLVPLPAVAPDKSVAKPAPRPTVGPSGKPAEGPTTDIELLRIDRLVITEKPLGAVLNHLGRRLGLDLHIDTEAIAAAGISLDQRISVKVEKATIDTLFKDLLAKTGLAYKRNGRTVEIGVKE